MHVSLVTMPYKDPEKRREFERRWRDKNREKVNAKRRKRWQERKRLRVVLNPLTRVECQVYLDRLQRRKAATRDVECRACTERVRERAAAKRRILERAREWKKANPEKVREYKRKWREKNREKLRDQQQAHREKVREQKRRWEEKNREKLQERERERKQANREKVRERQRKWRQAHPEKVREHERKRRQVHSEKRSEQKQRWRKNNPEKVKAQRERERARKKARLEEADEVAKEKAREQNRRYREANREKLRAQLKRWRRANPEKFKAQRERTREANNARTRRYHEAHKEERNRARRERYAQQKGCPVPPPPPPPMPCDCGACLACGGWGVSWKPAWHARLNAFYTKKDPPTPASLEELPLDLLESETETLSIASTSEIDSELGDRLETLLADESDSEVETGPATAPTRRSSRIATMPAVSYQDWEEENPMLEFLKRKAQLHAEGEDRILTRWELLQHRTERVDAIVEEMSMGVDPTRQLDRFHNQLERQDCVLDVMVSEDLLDFVDDQLLLL